MAIDIGSAATFLATHGRLIDRRRFDLLRQPSGENRAAVLATLDGYRNPDGGYGWGLEPDLRARESQPAGAQHALEVLAETAPLPSPHTTGLFDWLLATTLPDGGLPFALPVAEPAGCAPFWVEADPAKSSLQITAGVAAEALRLAARDESVRRHPWLEAATRYCLDAIARIDRDPFAYELSFALGFLDAATVSHPEVAGLLERLGRFVPADGAIPVAGGAPGETLRPLSFAPEPGRPVRPLVDARAVEDDLDRLERGQQPDGGWTVDFHSYSEAAALEWRGYVTVESLVTLRSNGRVSF